MAGRHIQTLMGRLNGRESKGENAVAETGFLKWGSQGSAVGQ